MRCYVRTAIAHWVQSCANLLLNIGDWDLRIDPYTPPWQIICLEEITLAE